ncbi:MAG TPA: CBS domain-containing protein, partial [Tepidisphaeraceae bacterium]|nr:CBS domain-containing protein [Tepidisphaeraceae bacterium]
RVPAEYVADFLDQVVVGDVMAKDVISLRAAQTLGEIRRWIAEGDSTSAHQGFPIVDDNGKLVGVLTRRSLLGSADPDDRRLGDLLQRPPMSTFADNTLRQAADQMVGGNIGRLPVVDRNDPGRVVGMITRSDLLSAHRRRISEFTDAQRSIRLRRLFSLRDQSNGDLAQSADQGRVES